MVKWFHSSAKLKWRTVHLLEDFIIIKLDIWECQSANKYMREARQKNLICILFLAFFWWLHFFLLFWNIGSFRKILGIPSLKSKHLRLYCSICPSIQLAWCLWASITFVQCRIYLSGAFPYYSHLVYHQLNFN